MKKITNS